ncbi:hypothetical protein [Streptomyces sp. WAC05374]|uniref:hypothetical protein n=1 Tax=Streptomyces sp. WAC05374 TaxID=2487420 RepID=UPI00135BCF3A|nr:hypothetical protein [Streptomyces sp. WAC05374]
MGQIAVAEFAQRVRERLGLLRVKGPTTITEQDLADRIGYEVAQAVVARRHG